MQFSSSLLNFLHSLTVEIVETWFYQVLDLLKMFVIVFPPITKL
jgi:hypothetical protein